MLTAQFQVIGEEGFTLDSLRPTAYNVSLYSVDNYGRPLATYVWTDEGGSDYDIKDVWVDADSNEVVTGVKFQVGDALFIQADSANDGIVSAGQVITKDVTFQLRKGLIYGGNPFPVAVKLNDIIPNSYGVAVYAKDAYGRPQTTYTYTDEGGSEYDIKDVWVDADSNEVIDDTVVVEAGDGLVIQANSDSDTITFPAPEL